VQRIIRAYDEHKARQAQQLSLLEPKPVAPPKLTIAEVPPRPASLPVTTEEPRLRN
jgi:hypothetical protein